MFRYSSVIPARSEEVFAWHTRPGALPRLLPPWQPVRIVRASDSLRDGITVLRMPAGRRWIAQHQAADYRAGRQFSDVLTSRPFLLPLSWQHTHEFHDDPLGMLMVDTVETAVPHRLLKPMFRFRHDQLAADIAALQWSRDLHPTPMTIAVSGSSGTVGASLVPFLRTLGHRVIRLTRRPVAHIDERHWDPSAPDAGLLIDVDVVIHLAGATVAGRFSPEHKAAIRRSRIEPTRLLVQAAAACGVRTFVCASAIGYYGADRGDEELTETSHAGDGFLADVVRDWEAATQGTAMRTVQVRTGIVQSPRGGALAVQLPLFKAAAGGPMGSGDQWNSWIGVDDLLDVYLRAVVDDRMSGPVNAVAPNPLRQRAYALTLGAVLRRPALLPTPAVALRAVLGFEGAQELPLASQRVLPQQLQQLGHRFRYEDLEPALRHQLGRS